MRPDANKSELTLRITEAAARWLDGIGAKPVETEVPVPGQWGVADLGAVWMPTWTECRRQKVVCAYGRQHWQTGEVCGVDRHTSQVTGLPLYTDLVMPLTIAHEVKASRSDFRRDEKWTRDPATSLRILSVPTGMIQPDEYPKGWWILLHSAKTGDLSKVAARAPIVEVPVEQKMWMIQSLAERTHHRNSRRRLNDLAKSHREFENDRINCNRLYTVIHAVMDVAKGKHATVEETLCWHLNRRRSPLPKDIMECLNRLHGVLKEPA